MPREIHALPKLRKLDLIKELTKDAVKLQQAKDARQILLCFTCDPYQKLDEEHRLTRRALQILFEHQLNVAILTKGGKRSERDFDILAANKDKAKYGVTLVFADDAEALKREPGAALTSERITSLKKAHDLGIKTFVSLEPVYYPADAFKLIHQTHEFVDQFKVGKLNYRPEAKEVDWRKFAKEVEQKLISLKKDYYIKEDLKKLL